MMIFNAKNVGLHLPDAVYVGRPSPFGNPYESGKDGTRADVIRMYEDWLLQQPELLAKVRTELRGKHLICWCFPKQCHAEVLMHYANEEDYDDAQPR